jgi:hypothetical protein
VGQTESVGQEGQERHDEVEEYEGQEGQADRLNKKTEVIPTIWITITERVTTKADFVIIF